MTERTCPQCGARFVPDHPRAKLCSIDCKWAFNAVRKSRDLRVCVICGRRFRPSGRGRPRKTCSGACTAQARLAKGRAPRLPEPDSSSFPLGSCRGPARSLMEKGQELFCEICGRPAGSDRHQWRVLPFRFTPSVQERPVVICPLHAGTDPRFIDEIVNRRWSSKKREEEAALQFPDEERTGRVDLEPG